MSESTPRTDAALVRLPGGAVCDLIGTGEIVSATFARQLERELATMTEAAKQALRASVRAEKAEKLWKEFITLMEITEESDSGYEFNPNKISSCRAIDGRRLNEILNEARQIVF